MLPFRDLAASGTLLWSSRLRQGAHLLTQTRMMSHDFCCYRLCSSLCWVIMEMGWWNRICISHVLCARGGRHRVRTSLLVSFVLCVIHSTKTTNTYFVSDVLYHMTSSWQIRSGVVNRKLYIHFDIKRNVPFSFWGEGREGRYFNNIKNSLHSHKFL